MKVFFTLFLIPLSAFCSEYELIYKTDIGQISYDLQSEIQVRSIDESLSLIDEALFKHYQLILQNPLSSLRVVVDYVYSGAKCTLTFIVSAEDKIIGPLHIIIFKANDELESAESAVCPKKADFDNMIEQSIKELLSTPNAKEAD